MSRWAGLATGLGAVSRTTGITILVIVVLLVGLRLAAPFLVLQQVNRILGSMED